MSKLTYNHFFNNCYIEFNYPYKARPDRFLRVGDIIRSTEPEVCFQIEVEYSIYTWIPELHRYLWASEWQLFRYSIQDGDILDIFNTDYGLVSDELENVKLVGNISEVKYRKKLDQIWLDNYKELFKY
jgi:hypothetical protein